MLEVQKSSQNATEKSIILYGQYTLNGYIRQKMHAKAYDNKAGSFVVFCLSRKRQKSYRLHRAMLVTKYAIPPSVQLRSKYRIFR